MGNIWKCQFLTGLNLEIFLIDNEVEEPNMPQYLPVNGGI